MDKTSVRLSPEMLQMLEREADNLSEIRGSAVTVSDLIRACIQAKFPKVSAAARRENTALVELREEVSRLREGSELLARDVERLVKKLSELIPQLATREQVDEVTEGIAAVIRNVRGR